MDSGTRGGTRVTRVVSSSVKRNLKRDSTARIATINFCFFDMGNNSYRVFSKREMKFNTSMLGEIRS